MHRLVAHRHARQEVEHAFLRAVRLVKGLEVGDELALLAQHRRQRRLRTGTTHEAGSGARMMLPRLFHARMHQSATRPEAGRATANAPTEETGKRGGGEGAERGEERAARRQTDHRGSLSLCTLLLVVRAATSALCLGKHPRQFRAHVLKLFCVHPHENHLRPSGSLLVFTQQLRGCGCAPVRADEPVQMQIYMHALCGRFARAYIYVCMYIYVYIYIYIYIHICNPGHRVSRPRGTGSVGDSVGEGPTTPSQSNRTSGSSPVCAGANVCPKTQNTTDIWHGGKRRLALGALRGRVP